MEGQWTPGRMAGVLSSGEGRAVDSAHIPGNHIHSLTSFCLGSRSTLKADFTVFPHPAWLLLPTGTRDSVCKQLWWPQLGRRAAIDIRKQNPGMTLDLLRGEAMLHGIGLSQC